MIKTTAIVVAAGEGRRLGAETPKTYLPVAGRPILLRTLDRLLQCQAVQDLTLVIAANEFARCEKLLGEDRHLSSLSIRLQSGGATRQQSVYRGLLTVAGSSDIVLVHDGARPFASAALFGRCIEQAERRGAVAVGLPVRDTIKMVGLDGRVESTPERSKLWEIQTPQAFRRELLVAAHDWAIRERIEATDDAMLVEKMGKPVWVLDGERHNIKITVPEDLWLAEMMVRERIVD